MIKYLDRGDNMLKTILSSELGYKTKSYKSGSEGYIYNILDETKLYKEFDVQTSMKIRENKKQKIILLEKLIDTTGVIPKIDSLVNDDLAEYLMGYVMEKCSGITLDLACFDFYKNLIILKKIKTYLEIFKKHNIQYIDFKGNNIIVDETNLETRILDIDNIRIEEHGVDLVPENFERYIINGGNLDFNGSLFAFNKMTYELLMLNNGRFYEADKKVLKFESSLDSDMPDSIADNEYLVDYIEPKKIKRFY